jgi:ABC-2 type transport system ATP-binding protein
MISIKNLIKEYNSKIVLNIDHLVINKGDILGIVGNNGAGKTTLIRIILDLVKADKGTVYSGNNLVSKSENWKDYTGSYLDNNFLIDFLTPEEYFYFIGKIYGLNNNEISIRVDSYLPFLKNEILGQDNKLIREFSLGNKQKIGIVSSLLMEPQVIILDEPFSSLDPSSQFTLQQILKKYCEENTKTIIISSHNLIHISGLCTRIALMEEGKIIKDCKNSSITMKDIEYYFNSQVIS